MIPRRDVTLFRGFLYYFHRWIFDSFSRRDYRLFFKRKIEQFLKTHDFFLMSRGRFAFDLIFDSVRYNEDSEIIVPNYYLKELVPKLKDKGLKPVFCDINEETLFLSIDDLKNKLTKKTKFVILPHMLGICGNLKEAMKTIKKSNDKIIIIEDCAHSFGSTYNEKHLGTFSDFALFSFDYIKPINLFGGGGLLVNNKKYLESVKRRYKDFHEPQKKGTLKKVIYYFVQTILMKSPLFYFIKLALRNKKSKSLVKKVHKSNSNRPEKLSQFQSFIGIHQLKNFHDKQKKLTNIRKEYINKLRDANIEVLNIGECDSYSNYSFFIKTKKDSDIINEKMFKMGIDVGIKDEVMDLCDVTSDNFSNSKHIFNHIVQIPFYYNLKPKAMKKIVNTIIEITK